MTKYQEQVRRSAAQANYWCDYRYTQGRRGTLLDFKNDVLPLSDEELNNPMYESGESESAEWLGRYVSDYRNKQTGRCIYTMPKPDRYEAVQAFVEEGGFLPPAALLDHTESAHAAELVAKSKGYDCYADQRLLAGTFRGTFMGAVLTAEGIRDYVLMCHFIPGEEYFRLRLFETCYQPRSGEDETALLQRSENMDWDSWSRRDGFASFGTNMGVLFLLRGEGVGTSSYDLSGFKFDNTGRRVLALNATLQGETGPEVCLQLCRHPKPINRYLDILRRISAEM